MLLTMRRFCLTLLLAFSGLAYGAQANNPAAVAEAYFAALKVSNFEKAADLFRKQDIVNYKVNFLPVFEQDKAIGDNQLIKATFGQDATLEHVKAASAQVFFGKIMDFAYNSRPGAKPTFDKIVILGLVEEPERKLVHVLTRSYVQFQTSGVKVDNVEVVSMTREAGVWKMVMPDKMKAMAKALQRAISIRQRSQGK